MKISKKIFFVSFFLSIFFVGLIFFIFLFFFNFTNEKDLEKKDEKKISQSFQCIRDRKLEFYEFPITININRLDTVNSNIDKTFFHFFDEKKIISIKKLTFFCPNYGDEIYIFDYRLNNPYIFNGELIQKTNFQISNREFVKSNVFQVKDKEFLTIVDVFDQGDYHLKMVKYSSSIPDLYELKKFFSGLSKLELKNGEKRYVDPIFGIKIDYSNADNIEVINKKYLQKRYSGSSNSENVIKFNTIFIDLFFDKNFLENSFDIGFKSTELNEPQKIQIGKIDYYFAIQKKSNNIIIFDEYKLSNDIYWVKTVNRVYTDKYFYISFYFDNSFFKEKNNFEFLKRVII